MALQRSTGVLVGICLWTLTVQEPLKATVVITAGIASAGADLGCSTNPPNPPSTFSLNVFYDESDLTTHPAGSLTAGGWATTSWSVSGGESARITARGSSTAGFNGAVCSPPEGGFGRYYGRGHADFSVTIELDQPYRYTSSLSGAISGVLNGEGFLDAGSHTISGSTLGISDGFSLDISLIPGPTCADLNPGVTEAVTGSPRCCADRNPGVTEPITDFPRCGPAGALSPKWGRFGSKEVLEADSGEKLQLDCVAGAVNWYRLSYTPPGGTSTRVGVCPFEAGCNSASFVHGGDLDKNGKPDCFLRTRWISRDYGKNDNPNPWTGAAVEGFLDWAESAFDAKSQNLTKTDYQYTYKVGPPLKGCLPPVKAEGPLQNTIVVDPPIGPETEAFFDEVIGRLQLLSPSDPMAGANALPCDLNDDGTCNGVDFLELSNALGACRGDQRYLPTADADLDGCVDSADQSTLFDALLDIKPGSFPNSINPKSHGVIPVALLNTTFGVPVGSVDPETARFGSTGTEAAPTHHALEDVDGDGDLDLILHFRTQETGIGCGDTSAYIRAKTTDGKEVGSVDIIRTVSCK